MPGSHPVTINQRDALSHKSEQTASRYLTGNQQETAVSDAIERDLVKASREIGKIHKINGRYTRELADAIRATGKNIMTLTVGELLEAQAAYNQLFYKNHRG
jgi:hypothetical protein